jgi:beta-glucosidase
MKLQKKAMFILLITVTIYILPVPIFSQNTNIEARINDLIVKMTLREKIGQLWQNDFKYSVSPEIQQEWIRKGDLGSLLSISDAKDCIKMSRTALKESRMGIPVLHARDVIHGFRTIFPIPLAQSCSWDAGLVEQGEFDINWTKFTQV